MEKNKTHYRKVFKSDHLGVADLEEYLEEGRTLIFTIKEVRQEFGVKVAGTKKDANIAYFKEQNVKPLVLNATNSKIIKSFNKNSPFLEDWANTRIELFIDSSVKMKGETVGGVRIKPKQPAITKPELTPSSPNWEKAKNGLKNGFLIEDIKTKYLLSSENEKLLCG